jgi:hypothetical protein
MKTEKIRSHRDVLGGNSSKDHTAEAYFRPFRSQIAICAILLKKAGGKGLGSSLANQFTATKMKKSRKLDR